MIKTENLQNIDISTVTQQDLKEIFPGSTCVLVSPEKELSDEENRILELQAFAELNQIPDLETMIEKQFFRSYPALFHDLK